ncbi:unnamed protein product [Durusdinium trenchii]|uniref:Uncharacterized protein n=1 Tax=Durusdinium trenchii TaxID=1381693 RepID=A0ABP0KR60_9DINO
MINLMAAPDTWNWPVQWPGSAEMQIRTSWIDADAKVCVLGAVAAAARWFGTEILELTAMDDGHKPRLTAVVGLNLIHCLAESFTPGCSLGNVDKALQLLTGDEDLQVPVFKHPVKKDLLPFEDRIAMCKLAVSASNIGVSSVEQETGESNAVMLRALRSKYPKGSRLLWVCGDDVFDWISNEKGQAMLAELDGLIVQRRLHKACDSQADRFYKAPVDSDKVRALVAEHRVHVDFIYGELPHYSSTLVRNSPASWRAFLPQKVAAYLDDRPALLAQLVRTGDAPASRVSPPASPLVVLDKNMLDDAEPGYQEDLEFEKELTDAAEIMLKTSSLELEVLEETSTSTTSTGADDEPQEQDAKSNTTHAIKAASTSCVMRCLATVHALQRERGHTALALALKGTPQGESAAKAMHDARAALDLLLKGDPVAERALRLSGLDAGAAGAVAEELRRTPLWLSSSVQVCAMSLFLSEKRMKR